MNTIESRTEALAADARRFRFFLSATQRAKDPALLATIEACVDEMFGKDSEEIPTEDQVRALIDLAMERTQWHG